MGDVKSMVAKLNEDLSSIDVLFNNAGILKTSNSITESGLDIRMVVNYLASYALTNGVLPLLEKGDQPRIINLISAAQASVSVGSFQKNAMLSAVSENPFEGMSNDVPITTVSRGIEMDIREIIGDDKKLIPAGIPEVNYTQM